MRGGGRERAGGCWAASGSAGSLTLRFVEDVGYLDVCSEFLLSVVAHLRIVVELCIVPLRSTSSAASSSILIPVIVLIAATATTTTAAGCTVVAPIIVAATTASATIFVAPVVVHVLATRHHTSNTRATDSGLEEATAADGVEQTDRVETDESATCLPEQSKVRSHISASQESKISRDPESPGRG